MRLGQSKGTANQYNSCLFEQEANGEAEAKKLAA